MLIRNPGHTAAAVLALALGIGLSTAMFSIVYGILLRGLPFEQSERIVHVGSASASTSTTFWSTGSARRPSRGSPPTPRGRST
jgi:hypothetical protein